LGNSLSQPLEHPSTLRGKEVQYKIPNSTCWDYNKASRGGFIIQVGPFFPFLILTWFPSPSSFLLLHYHTIPFQTRLNPPINSAPNTLIRSSAAPTSHYLTYPPPALLHLLPTTSYYLLYLHLHTAILLQGACRYLLPFLLPQPTIRSLPSL
jgi:hypothetical protein